MNILSREYKVKIKMYPIYSIKKKKTRIRRILIRKEKQSAKRDRSKDVDPLTRRKGRYLGF